MSATVIAVVNPATTQDAIHLHNTQAELIVLYMQLTNAFQLLSFLMFNT